MKGSGHEERHNNAPKKCGEMHENAGIFAKSDKKRNFRILQTFQILFSKSAKMRQTPTPPQNVQKCCIMHRASPHGEPRAEDNNVGEDEMLQKIQFILALMRNTNWQVESQYCTAHVILQRSQCHGVSQICCYSGYRAPEKRKSAV